MNPHLHDYQVKLAHFLNIHTNSYQGLHELALIEAIETIF